MIVEIGTVNTGYWVEISHIITPYMVEISESPGPSPAPPSTGDLIFTENSINLLTENNVDLAVE